MLALGIKFTNDMKRIAVLLLIVLWGNIFAQERQQKIVVDLDYIPQSLSEFIALRDELAKTPQGGATMFILAMEAFAQKRPHGEKALVVTIDKSKLVQGSTYKGYSLGYDYRNYMKSNLRRFPYIPYSYFAGTSPDKGYKIGGPPWQIYFEPADTPDELKKREMVSLYVLCSGANKRKVTLKRNSRGLWKVYDFAQLYQGVETPVEVADDDL